MKNKIINTLGFIIVIYGLALGFVLIIGMLDYTDPIMIFVILPASYFIAIYEYSINKTIKQQYKESTSALLIDRDNKDKQIANYELLDEIRCKKLDDSRDEITELKEELASTVKPKSIVLDGVEFKGKDLDYLIKCSKDGEEQEISIFNNDDGTLNNITQIWVCPECGSTMTRSSKSIVFCDNIECTRKQFKKSALSTTEVMK